MAPEIIKALKLSGVEPPENLIALANQYRMAIA